MHSTGVGRPTAVTTKDIAQASGVSTATVSYVLSGRADARVSEQTRQRVIEVAQRMGYRRNGVAAALRTGKTHTLGIVCPFGLGRAPAASRAAYAKDMMLAASIAAARAGFLATFFVDTPLTTLHPKDVTDGRLDGVIIIGAYDAEAWVQSVYATGVPCVEIGSRYGPFQVHADSVGGARLAVEYLLQLGHRHIGHWRGPRLVYSAQAREQGFLETVRAAGLPEEDAPVIEEEAQFDAVVQRPRRPTAFFLYNDERAPNALDRIHAAGLQVPRDVSLIGFDNDLRATVVRPQLTTIQNPLDAMAEAAVRLVNAQITGAALEPTPVLIPTHLVVRHSIAAPPP